MDDVTYWAEVYMKEYNETKKEHQEKWLKDFFSTFAELRIKYEKISSNLAPEAAELIGEIRERKLIVSYLNNKCKNLSHPNDIRIYEEIANAINSGEHF
jgi:hypothetical protein